MSSVPKRPNGSRKARPAPVREDGTPILLSDYLSDAEMDRLAAVLVDLHLSVVRDLRAQGLTDRQIRARFKGNRARRDAEAES